MRAHISLINTDAHIRRRKFCVSVSGFKAPGSLSAGVFGTSYSTPTLHVIGKTDIIVVEERSKILLDLSQNKTLEEHEGGQLVPLCVVTCF